MNEGTRGQFKIGELLFGIGVAAGRLIAGAGAPTNGTSGTGAGRANPGSMYVDTTNGVRWQNVGTSASPVWTPVDLVSLAISSANILAMFGASVNLIVAPPAGYALLVHNILFTIVRTATAYAGGGVVTFIYTGSVAAHAGSIPAAVITGGAGTVLTQLGPATGANGTTVPTATGLDITNATAAFTAGTCTAVARLSYSVVKQAA
jgi:hypothetical protein